jgi:hypothetical protein
MGTDGSVKLPAIFLAKENAKWLPQLVTYVLPNKLFKRTIFCLCFITIWWSCIAKYLLEIWRSLTAIYLLCMSNQINYSKQECFIYFLSQFSNQVLLNTCQKFGILLLLSAYVYDPTYIGPQYNKKLYMVGINMRYKCK